MAVMNKMNKWISLIAFLPLVGCASFQDMHYEHTQKIRTEMAYLHFKWCSEEKITSDYGKGWKAGYLDVLTGGDGTPPIVAPKKYWSPKQITHHMDQKRHNWYTGFQDGAVMASVEPDTHYVKIWSPPMSASHAGYYHATSTDTNNAIPSAPIVDGADMTSPLDSNVPGSATPGTLRDPNLPPVPAAPERWKDGMNPDRPVLERPPVDSPPALDRPQ